MVGVRRFLGVVSLFLVFSVLLLIVVNVNLESPVFQVESCSNYPVLSPGNIVIVEDTSFDGIYEGDTVIYSVSSRDFVVAHQVINKSKDFLQTKGRNNGQQLNFEKNVEPSQIHGTPAFVIPFNQQQSCSKG